jgi:putative transposase
MNRKPYSTDLTDAQWERLEPHIPPAKPGGRDRSVNMREVMNAINYVLRTGCHWHLLPHDFPPSGTVYWYFWTWRNESAWQQMHDILREQVRTAAGREISPSAAILDSQMVKSTAKGGRPASTAPKRLKAANAHCWSTHWV